MGGRRGASRGRSADSAARPTLVGREAELAELAGFSDELLAERSAGLATIVGAPGVGKSRLLLEFVRRLEESFTVHRGKCLSYGEGITYWPIVEIVKSAAGILQSDDRETQARRSSTPSSSRSPTDDLDELRTIASALSNLIGIPTTPRGTYATSEISQAELHWGIRRVLQLLASEKPTAVVVEDLHWAEPTLLELISYLLDDEAGRAARGHLPRTRPSWRTPRPASSAREANGAPSTCRRSGRSRQLLCWAVSPATLPSRTRRSPRR